MLKQFNSLLITGVYKMNDTRLVFTNEESKINIKKGTSNINTIHLNKKTTAHWSNDKAVINLYIDKHIKSDGIQIDITETSIETQHEKRVMFSLNKNEIKALIKELKNLS